MNELSRHIEILLLDNDCVIVPGFGGFMAHHIPSQYITEEGIFYPPQRTIGFNSQLKLNDSLLVQSYVEAYDISYPEAVRRIESELEEIKQTISVEGSFEFHGIGIISMKSDGNYEFEPCTAGLLTPSLYALNSYSFNLLHPAASINVPVEGITSTIRETKLVQNISQPIDEEESLNFYEDEEEEAHIRLRVKTLRNIIAAAMLLLFMVIPSIPAGKGSSNTSRCSIVNMEMLSKMFATNQDTILLPNDSLSSLQPTDSIVGSKETDLSDQDSKSEIEEHLPQQTHGNHFAIVLASRISSQGAQEYVDKLKKEGHKQVCIYEQKGKRMVIYGNYATEQEAYQQLLQLREADEMLNDAWISKI